MKLEKIFHLKENKTDVRTEVIAGVTTFMTMAYILAVNPTILATTGMDKGALFTATAIASAIATFLLAFMAKLPFAQAPSMGLNAFFAFTLCQAMGLTWQQALAVLLVEGIIFLAITFLNIRDKILECIPKNLRFAISAGIGMFIAFYRFEECGHHYCQCGYFRATRQVYTSQHPGSHQHPALWLSDGEKSEGFPVYRHHHLYIDWYSDGCNPVL